MNLESSLKTIKKCVKDKKLADKEPNFADFLTKEEDISIDQIDYEIDIKKEQFVNNPIVISNYL